EKVLVKERLHPGKIFLVDTAQGRIIDDDEIKAQLAAERPYGDWLRQNQVRLEDVAAAPVTESDHATVLTRQMAFGYTHEDLRMLLAPMARNGEEPIGSMGTDTSLAVLSDRPRPLYDYFKQLFAQVTNPPLDQIREELVTAMESTVGPEGNLLKAEPGSCRQIVLKDPVLSNEDLAKLAHVSELGFKAVTLAMLYPVSEGATGLERAKAVKNYIKALNKGILKVMAKMGISTLQSYCGAQIFEAIGLNRAVVDRYFTGTASRVSGIGIEVIAEEVRRRHTAAYPERP